MTTEQIKACGRIYALLRKALGKDNLADNRNVMTLPLHMITAYTTEAHRRGVVTAKLDKELMDFWCLFDKETVKEWFEKPLNLEQQGQLSLAIHQTMYSIEGKQ